MNLYVRKRRLRKLIPVSEEVRCMELFSYSPLQTVEIKISRDTSMF